MTRPHFSSARLRQTVLVAAATLAVLGASGCAASVSTSTTVASIPAGLSVEGYGVADESTLTALDEDKGAVDIVGISGVSLTAQGQGVAASSQESLAIAAAAAKQKIDSELLVNNVDATTSDFSAALATAMLSSEDNRQFVIAGLAGEVDHGGYTGIQIDLENLGQSNAADLVTFAKELRETLPSTATVSMAVTAQTSTAGYLAAGYDLEALSPYVGRFVLMAYDEHGFGFSSAGPVGGLPWTSQAISAMTSLVAAKKIDLGVAGYGYEWKTNGKGGSLSPGEARSLAGDRASWVSAQGEWTAKLSDGTVLWWSDARSLTTRANLAVADKLHGVALWQMSSGDKMVRASS